MKFFSRSGNFVYGQGNLERTWKVWEKSGIVKINGYGKQSSENLFILFKRGKDVHSHEILISLSPSPSPLGATLKGNGSQFFLLRVTPKFEVLQLTPLK